jgi:hypothetical protein
METKVEILGREAMSLACAMLKNEYNQAQSFAAVDRIQQICKEIGGTPRELVSNAQRFLDKQEQEQK